MMSLVETLYNKRIWGKIHILIISLILFVFVFNSLYLCKLTNNIKQMEFASFEPLMPNLQEDTLKYYQDNNIEIPNNKYFHEYFNVPKEESPKVDFVDQTIMDHPLYNKSTYKVKVPEKDLSADLADYQIIAPKATTIAGRNNNPGNLMFANQPLAIKGEPKKGGGFWASYKSLEEGLISLMRQIELDKKRGHTVQSFLEKYAPKTENDTAKYIQNLATQLAVTPDTQLSSIPTINITKIIAKIESGTQLVPKK